MKEDMNFLIIHSPFIASPEPYSGFINHDN